MSPECGGKGGAECLNTRLPLSTLLQAGYNIYLKKNVKLIVAIVEDVAKKTVVENYFHVLAPD